LNNEGWTRYGTMCFLHLATTRPHAAYFSVSDYCGQPNQANKPLRTWLAALRLDPADLAAKGGTQEVESVTFQIYTAEI